MLLLNKNCIVDNIDDVLVLDGGVFCAFYDENNQIHSAYFQDLSHITELSLRNLGVNESFSVKAIGPNSHLTALKVIARDLGFNIIKEKSYTADQSSIRYNSETGLLQVISDVENTRSSKTINVMTIDDSKVIHLAMKKILEGQESIQVVSQVLCPLDVEEELKRHQVDFITLDIHMPEMNGIDVYKKIIKPLGIPTMVLSSLNDQSSEDIFKMLDLGVCDFFEKPSFDNIIDVGSCMRDKIIALSKSKVIDVQNQSKEFFSSVSASDVVIIGSSTGGTKAVEYLLSHFEGEIPTIIVAQHIPSFFSTEYSKRLDSILPYNVNHIESNMELKPGEIYICPGDRNTTLTKKNSRFVFSVKDNCETLFSPSIDTLFASCLGFTNDLNFLPIILTGMGGDGAVSIKKFKDEGLFTIGQNQESCVVYGMSKRAKELGGISVELSLEEMPKSISDYFSSYKNKKVS